MKTKFSRLLSCLVAVSCFYFTNAKAELRLASPYTDHMVLQCEVPVPVWGWADPGMTITVEFAEQKKACIADADGRWRIDLDALSASFESRTLTVFTGAIISGEIFRCSDVLVGEVWICSGQSNMQFAVASVPEVKALLPLPGHVRSFEVARTVAFEEQDTLQGEWMIGAPSSAVACSFAHFLGQSTDTPVGIILTAWGSTSIEAWMPRDMAEELPYFKTIMDEWDANTADQEIIRATLEGPKPWSRNEDIFLRRHSNIVYNAMMHPLVPYACRGLVWYQGERNTRSMCGMEMDPWFARTSGMLQYGDVLKAWIRRYRKGWDNEEMHFLVVMLPGLGKTLESGPESEPDSPLAHSWAWMREAQLKALELPHTSVANTIDLGDLTNAHPKNKLPVGERLALLAARDVYGKDILAQGPAFKEVELKGDSIIVHLKFAEGLKTMDGKAPSAFWLADDSGRWVRAEARLDRESVILWSDKLSKPLYVRYAFAGMPELNLVNESGLPAYPFRTDNFKP